MGFTHGQDVHKHAKARFEVKRTMILVIFMKGSDQYLIVLRPV